MARILFLSQLIPYPPDSGPKVRSYFVLRHLAQDHAVTLIAFSRPDDSPEAVAHLKSFCESVHTVPMERSPLRDLRHLIESLLSNRSFIIRRDTVHEMQALVDRELQRLSYDFVHADQLWMAQYALRPRRNQPKPALILDEHNACYQIFQRLAQGERNPAKKIVLEREWRALRKYEAWACSQFDQVVTVTDEDRGTLSSLTKKFHPNQKPPDFSVIPICVDTELQQPIQPIPGTKNVLHMGTMFWMPNVEGVAWFIREVWGLVKQEIPEASFTIVGKRPPADLQRMADQDPSIRITGYVADPLPYLQDCAAFIVPLHSGSGMRVKIVESWARGLPMISTRIGAEGLQYEENENILIADSPAAFAKATVRLLQDDALNQKLRRRGREWVEQAYDWRKMYAAWETVYLNARK